ncbi:Protein GREB1, partial [Frankliniella fusca]
ATVQHLSGADRRAPLPRRHPVRGRLERARPQARPGPPRAPGRHALRRRLQGWHVCRRGRHDLLGRRQVRGRADAGLVPRARRVLASRRHEVRGRVPRRPHLGTRPGDLPRQQPRFPAQRGFLPGLPHGAPEVLSRGGAARPASRPARPPAKGPARARRLGAPARPETIIAKYDRVRPEIHCEKFRKRYGKIYHD